MKNSALAAAAVFTGGLWTTLLFRQVAAALWFTILIPVVLLYSVAELMVSIFHLARPLPEWSLFAVLAVYSIAGFLWARWQFLHAQDIQWTGGPVSLPAWLGFGTRPRSTAELPNRKPLRALIRKEFQSHHVSLLIAGILLLLHLAAITIRSVRPGALQPNDILQTVLEFWWSLWLALPLVIGSSAVAEERKLGTLESQLCQPTTRRMQLVAKLTVALVLGIFLGGFMSWLLESAGARLGGANPIASVFSKVEFASQPLLMTGLAAAWITFISFYASTLTRNTLQAIGAAILAGLPLTGIMGWAIEASPGYRHDLWGISLLGWIGLPALLATLLWLTFKNYKHLHVGWNVWLRNLVTIFIVLTFATVAASTIYKRPWELLMTLEPRHGPAQLSGPVRPRICVTQGFEVFVLLPDGRIWVAQNYEGKEVGEHAWDERKSRREKIYMPVPVEGTFLATSNWVSLVNSHNQVAGIRSDGTLWKVFSRNPRSNSQWTRMVPTPEPERIGADSNWRAIAAGGSHFLALKADGTLWGWGDNGEGQLGVGPKQILDDPGRIGTASDWATVFAGHQTSVGVKRDGSVWKWGQLNIGPDGWQGWKGGAHPEPVRWNSEGADWIARAGSFTFDLVLRKDATLWAAGLLPENLLGNDFEREFVAKLGRVGHDSDWADVGGWHETLVAIKRDVCAK
jgi:ABC-type transport system involved in multi-copper enzyme maturation permease subunit